MDRRMWWLAVGTALAVAGCASGAPPGGSGDSGPTLDAAAADAGAGDGGEDAAVVEEVGLCDECVVHEQCGSLARCIPLSGDGHACLAICNPDIPSCPRGFECVIRPASPDFPVCAPVGERCCVDQDADGYGRGLGCEGPDCDDEALEVNPGADELCNGADDDCDDTVDEEAMECGGQDCDVAGEGFEETGPGACESGTCAEGERVTCGQYSCIDGAENGDRCATTCAVGGFDSDLYCRASAHCDLGECLPDLPNGEVCDEPSDCASEHCRNGFCCDDGDCCAMDTDCPGFGGVGTTCDDSATCQGSRGEVLCQMNQCATRSGVPDDSACDSSVEANTCGFFDSVFCTGEVDQTAPMCPGVCSRDDECDAGAHCDTTCVPDEPDGGLCDEDSDCLSGHCQNNVCCRGGDCCRDATDCPASYSSAPVCDTPTSCQGHRDAAQCMEFQCSTMTGVGDDSACGTDVVASDCGLYPAQRCSGLPVQPSPTCAMSCTSDSECDTNAHCDLNACVPDQPDGEACDEASDCVSDHCQNGFCCAGGDCCSNGSDCPFAAYGEPSTCTSAMTCQGERRDPACTPTFQCVRGSTVPDDSGCSGLQASDCGLYPAVFCTGAEFQPADPAAMCDSSCGGDGDCDPGAFCDAGVCVPRGEQGDACTGTADCESGLQCVDGVCCSSSCTGTCQACNVAGSEGTCTPIPSGADPAGECAGFSCSDYYSSWVGDVCYRRANASGADVGCNGAGMCETAADVCPSQGQGGVQINCDDLCQSPQAGTCNGTTAGVCANVTPSPATQTCGIGECRQTVNRCNSGTPVICSGGTGGAEICNGLDDDCDTRFDEDLAQDAWDMPSNDNCATQFDLGTVNTSNPGATRTYTPTIYPSGDFDYYLIEAQENDSTCHCCDFFCTDEDIGVNVRIDVPSGVGSYQLCLQSSSGCPTWSNCVTVSGGSAGTRTAWRDGCCAPVGCSDSGNFAIRVRGVGSPTYTCAPYTLTINGMGGCD